MAVYKVTFTLMKHHTAEVEAACEDDAIADAYIIMDDTFTDKGWCVDLEEVEKVK